MRGVTTAGGGDYGGRGEGLGLFSDLIPGIPPEAVDALVTAPAAELGVTGAQLGPTVRIIPKDPEDPCPQPDLIECFEVAYPDEPGFFMLSPIGFDASGELALLHRLFWCGPRCGGGTLVLLERTPEGWAVRQFGRYPQRAFRRSRGR